MAVILERRFLLVCALILAVYIVLYRRIRLLNDHVTEEKSVDSNLSDAMDKRREASHHGLQQSTNKSNEFLHKKQPSYKHLYMQPSKMQNVSKKRVSSTYGWSDAVKASRKQSSVINIANLQLNQTEHFFNVTNAGVNDIISDANIVIIVAYMRTGSSLTGALFQEYERSFYLFEPIRTIYERLSYSGRHIVPMLNYLHGEKRTYRNDERDDAILNEIKNWLSCKLDRLSVESLTESFHKEYTKIMRKFYYCSQGAYLHTGIIRRTRQHRSQVLRHYFDTASRINTCVKNAIKSCNDAPAIFLKFIRLRMSSVEALLPLFPNLKIIHLNRDPRGIFNSRLHLHVFNKNDLLSNIRNHCRDWNTDLTTSKRILQKYPKRLKIVQYEELAERPIQTAKELVAFSGLTFTRAMAKFIQTNTASFIDSCTYCTGRKNSTLTANKWRSKISFAHARMIYNTCITENKLFGYLPFVKVNDLTNMSIPSREILNVTRALLNDDIF